MSVLKDKAKAIAHYLKDLNLLDPLDVNKAEREILNALKIGGTYQFLEGSNNEIMVKTQIKDVKGKTIAMQG
mgnify:CR=1 FL=1